MATLQLCLSCNTPSSCRTRRQCARNSARLAETADGGSSDAVFDVLDSGSTRDIGGRDATCGGGCEGTCGFILFSRI